MSLLLFATLATIVGANELLKNQTKPIELSSSITTQAKGEVSKNKIPMTFVKKSEVFEAGKSDHKKAVLRWEPNSLTIDGDRRVLRDNEPDPPWMK